MDRQRKAQQQNANEPFGKRGFRYHWRVGSVWPFRAALSRSPINRMYLPTHTETLGCMYDGAYETVCTHKDAGSPQWIAFTRRTTTDVPTFIHGLYSPSCAPIHAHGEEYAHQDRNDSIRCVCIQCISTFIRELKLLTLGRELIPGQIGRGWILLSFLLLENGKNGNCYHFVRIDISRELIGFSLRSKKYLLLENSMCFIFYFVFEN